jgi:hypothetical protein
MKYTFFIFLFSSTLIFAQNEKIEAEQRIKSTEVPTKSIEWLRQSFPNTRKVKWYQETTSGVKSFEAKFKLNSNKYSVEFSENGLIEDVEILREIDRIEEPYLSNLKDAFGQIEKFKLSKIQEQWTSDFSEKLSLAIRENNSALITIRFEVEFTAIIDESFSLWEGLFDQNGNLLYKRKVKLRATDNLDY